MAKANKKNKPVLKKDQNKSGKDHGLFGGTEFSKTTDENYLISEQEQYMAVNAANEISQEKQDTLKEEERGAKIATADQTVDADGSVEIPYEHKEGKTEDPIKGQNIVSQKQGYKSGEVVSWDIPLGSSDTPKEQKVDDTLAGGENVREETAVKPEIITKEVNFDINKPVFIEIHNGNIFHYFSSGLIAPAKYLSQRAFPDLQTINENFLVLVNGHSHAAHGDHILLEIDLSEMNAKAILIHDNFALLETPVSISRIKSIFVQDQLIMDSIINNALVFNGGFIPEKLVKVKRAENTQYYDVKNFKVEKPSDYRLKIDKFDRILGLLAFVRNYDILISTKSKVYRTLPNHFFYAMQVLDGDFGTEIVPKNTVSEFYSYLFNDNCPPEKELLKWIFSRVNVNDNFTDVDTLEFGKLLTAVNEDADSLRKEFLTHLSKNLERKKALKFIDESKSKSKLQLYIFAFLRNYGNLNNIDISRKDIESVYSNSFGEYAFAVLGYFYGYANLRNTDERISLPDMLLDFIVSKPPVKFPLTTRFDYMVLELVYQFVFKGGESKDKSSIRVPEDLVDEKVGMKWGVANFQIAESAIYGKLYQTILFRDPFDSILEEVLRLPDEIPLGSDLGLFCQRARIGIRPLVISNLAQVGTIYEKIRFSREDLYRYLSENRRTVDIEEIRQRLQLQKKYTK